MYKKNLTVLQRIVRPTPIFFKKLRSIGLIIGAISAAIITAPVTLPTIAITLAGYLAVAGGIITAVSQTAVEQE